MMVAMIGVEKHWWHQHVTSHLNLVVFGVASSPCWHVLKAAGDLAKKKTFPSIFQLLVAEGFVVAVSLAWVATPNEQGQVGSRIADTIYVDIGDDPDYHKDISDTESLPIAQVHVPTVGFFSLTLQTDWMMENVALVNFKDVETFRLRAVWEFRVHEDKHSCDVGGVNATLFEGLPQLEKSGLWELHKCLQTNANGLVDNRIFYLALPFLFREAVKLIRQALEDRVGIRVEDLQRSAVPACVIVEKPFGHDLQSAGVGLGTVTFRAGKRSQVYRIDHYLAKNMGLRNILAVRLYDFDSLPVVARMADNVSIVRITFKENINVAGRAGYFDGLSLGYSKPACDLLQPDPDTDQDERYGIIRVASSAAQGEWDRFCRQKALYKRDFTSENLI
ncbi:Glucose-6-phosphate 1-dehydrogenase [Symbiodinium microadriaticum]|uniref:glucose-6-phosphate dehydrogenase (NADP(+)) n=1 Tax=Symbiodinium microadriaticum TaxID=2951 RepID=A0A1Q9F4V3_SYMMI|nr:Glucose-6-phosphate 1-dehydrogenase [Symbiodinium microadriaticum]